MRGLLPADLRLTSQSLSKLYNQFSLSSVVTTSVSIMSAITEVSNNFCFGGQQKVFSHESKELQCTVNFAVFLPQASETTKLPVIYWLSGLTCNEQNFIQKSGGQRYAAEKNVILVCPDTSPRGPNIPDDEAYDLGQGAGFYVDATQEPYKKNFRMYSYVTSELPAVIQANFNVLPNKQSIMGHSMGGHGALICALKNPGIFQSVSAFAPISNPIECDWGKKAFNAYLGPDIQEWSAYDATKLVKSYNGPQINILIDQGSEDQFLKSKQLLPENFTKACEGNNLVSVTTNIREKYDHSYYFIVSFIQDHINFHAKYLKNQ